MGRSARPVLKTNGPLGTRWPPLLSLLLTSLWSACWRCGLMRRGRCHAWLHTRRSTGLSFAFSLLLFAALLAFCLLWRRQWRCHAWLHTRRSTGLSFAFSLLLFAALLAFCLLWRRQWRCHALLHTRRSTGLRL